MIAFIGDKHSIRPYQLFGFETYTAETPADAEKALEKIAESEPEAVFMTEDLFEGALSKAKEMEIHIVAVPAAAGSTGRGGKYIREALRKALGAEVDSEAYKKQSAEESAGSAGSGRLKSG